jgi:hypothetical protein
MPNPLRMRNYLRGRNHLPVHRAGIRIRVHTDHLNAQVSHELGLSMLLHEAVYSSIDKFACQKCQMIEVNVQNAKGHERAFVLITDAIDGAMETLLDVHFDSILRIVTWQVVREHMHDLQSMHDLVE